MDELKSFLGTENDLFEETAEDQKKKDEAAKKKANNNNAKNIELAKLYEDAAEYEEELEAFEAELEVINSNKIEDFATAFSKAFPDEERDYPTELQGILVSGWTYGVEVQKTHSAEHLDLIKETKLSDVVEKLTTAFPEYDGSFEASVREIFTNRWKTLISIKKDHLKEEIDDIYIAGLKPSFVKRIYKQVHGITKK